MLGFLSGQVDYERTGPRNRIFQNEGREKIPEEMHWGEIKASQGMAAQSSIMVEVKEEWWLPMA